MFRYVHPELPNLLRRFGIDQVFDVGANRGQFARELFHGGYRGSILSFEPLSQAHAELLEASADEPRWQVADRCAISDRTGWMTLNISGNSESSSLLPMLPAHLAAAPASRYIGSEVVPVHRLDDLVNSELAARETFLKLDVQGYEGPALQGAVGLLPSLAGLQVELSLLPLYEGGALAEELLPRLRQLGFGIYALEPGFADRRSSRILQVDAIFFREIPSRA